jgi:osmotically-inducible protein OsmY
MEERIKNDIKLLADVRRAIEADPAMENESIGVAVHDGIVMLTGAVTSYAKKWSAEQAAIAVEGVRGVANELVVHPPFGIPDAKIALAAVEALRAAPTVPTDTVKVEVASGWLSLDGEVNSDQERRAAEEAVRTLPGILGISNNITVRAA